MIPTYCHECHGRGKKIELEPNTDMAVFVFCKTCEGTGVRYIYPDEPKQDGR